MEPVTIKVGGVCCSHCDSKIKHAISQVGGVEEVAFNNHTHEAYVLGEFQQNAVEGAITSLGYTIQK